MISWQTKSSWTVAYAEPGKNYSFVLEIVLMLDMSCSEFKSFLVYTIQEGQHNFSHLHTSRSFVLLHSGDFYSYSLSVTPRTLYTLLLLLRETINTPNPWWTPSLSLLVSENSPFENILVWTDWYGNQLEFLSQGPLDILVGEPVDIPVKEAVHILEGHFQHLWSLLGTWSILKHTKA